MSLRLPPPRDSSLSTRENRAALRELDDEFRDRTQVTVTFSGGSVAVNHGLGRPPTRWQVVDLTAAAIIFRVGAAERDTITLQASVTPVTATLIFW